MDFDRFTVVFLISAENPPDLDEEAAEELQDRHLAFLAQLHESGEVLAAGPAGDPEQPKRRIRGIKLMRGDVDEARALAEQDPAVQAGVFELEVMPWVVPAGAMQFSRTRFPHSAAEASS
jgi:uncharacterized protein YciI